MPLLVQVLIARGNYFRLPFLLPVCKSGMPVDSYTIPVRGLWLKGYDKPYRAPTGVPAVVIPLSAVGVVGGSRLVILPSANKCLLGCGGDVSVSRRYGS
jgi:hypothetical protein